MTSVDPDTVRVWAHARAPSVCDTYMRAHLQVINQVDKQNETEEDALGNWMQNKKWFQLN